jgi:hypothetical protein
VKQPLRTSKRGRSPVEKPTGTQGLEGLATCRLAGCDSLASSSPASLFRPVGLARHWQLPLNRP